MLEPAGAARPATAARGWVGPAALALLAAAAGATVSALSAFGTAAQAGLVLAIGAIGPALILFTVRPHLALACYLVLLPLALGRPLVGGLNGGELLTIGALVLGMGSLWTARARVPPAVRSLRLVVYPLMGLAIVGLLSLIANGITDPGEILDGLFKMLAFGGIAVLVHMHARSERITLMLMHCLAGGAVLVALYAVIAYLLGWSYDPLYGWNRASGTFEDWNVLGGYMVLMSGTTLGLAAVTRNATWRFVLVVGVVLQVAAMLLSLTLGSVVALVVGAVLVLVFIARVGWTRVVGSGVLFATGFATILLTNPVLRAKFTHIDERVLDRMRSYAVGVSMFRDKFLLGFGTQAEVLDALWYGERDYGLTVFGVSSSVPHNAILLIGVEKGAVGALLFIALLAGLLVLMLRQRRALAPRYRLLYAGVMVSAFGFLFQNLANNLILHARVGILFFALVALMVRLTESTHLPAGRAGLGP